MENKSSDQHNKSIDYVFSTKLFKNDKNKHKKYFKSNNYLNTKDLDHICGLKIRNNLMMVQRTGINYVRVFNLESNKLVKTYQIDDGKNDNNKFKIYDSGISFDRQYAILCVGIFNKENLSNLDLNRSALKGFKIPKCSKKIKIPTTFSFLFFYIFSRFLFFLFLFFLILV